MNSRQTRRAMLTGMAATCFAPSQLFAQSLEENVARQLDGLGYDNIQVRRTLLGRLRFVAERDGVVREIVINPSTGVILRDFSRQTTGGDREIEITEPVDGAEEDEEDGRRARNERKDDEDWEDEEDDHDDEDDEDHDDEGDDDDADEEEDEPDDEDDGDEDDEDDDGDDDDGDDEDD